MKTQKVMDIAKPGSLKTSAAASARPVIVTNRVVIQDPMVKTDSDDVKKEEAAVAAPSTPKEKLVITPLSDPARTPEDAKENKDAAKEGLLDLPIAGLDDDTEQDPDTEKTDKPIKKAADKPEAVEAKESAKTDSDEPAEDPEPTEVGGDSDAPADGAAKKASVKDDAEVKAQEELSQLIEDKEYFLPINTAEHRRSLIVVVLGAVVILVLAAAWVNIALDAGLIDIPGIKPLTNFFG